MKMSKCSRDQAANEGHNVCTDTLGAALEKLVPKERIFAADLTRKGTPDLCYLIFGHTHIPEKLWPVRNKNQLLGQVVNSGAFFQRIINKADFLDLIAQKQTTAAQGLEQIKVEELQPAYTYVRVRFKDGGFQEPEVWQWLMPETAATGSQLEY